MKSNRRLLKDLKEIDIKDSPLIEGPSYLPSVLASFCVKPIRYVVPKLSFGFVLKEACCGKLLSPKIKMAAAKNYKLLLLILMKQET